MSLPFPYTNVHHFALSITDMERSLAFYEKLGFDKVREFNNKTLICNDVVVIGLEVTRNVNDQFDPQRVGLDHLSFQMAKVEDLETAVAYFNEHGIPHNGITDLSAQENGLPFVILPFFDPDGIALEFTVRL